MESSLRGACAATLMVTRVRYERDEFGRMFVVVEEDISLAILEEDKAKGLKRKLV